MNLTEIPSELKAELTALVRKELEEQLKMRRENRSAYQNVCKDFEPEMQQYNLPGDERWGYRVQNGISALLRTMYHVDYVVKIPASAEPQIRAFFQGVLDLMEQYAPKTKSDT